MNPNNPQNRYPQEWYPQEWYPEAEYFQPGYPQPGYPQPGYPQPAKPQAGGGRRGSVTLPFNAEIMKKWLNDRKRPDLADKYEGLLEFQKKAADKLKANYRESCSKFMDDLLKMIEKHIIVYGLYYMKILP